MKCALIASIKKFENLENILKGIENQVVQANCLYFLLNNFTEDKIEKSRSITENSIFRDIIEVITGNSHLELLNEGVESALSDDCQCFIFIEGIPQRTLVQSHLRKLTLGLPVLSFGRKRELVYKWKDKREVDSALSKLNIFREGGILINNTALLEKFLIDGCNIGLNDIAIKLLMKFNKTYYGVDEVFSGNFRNGGELAFLSIECQYCKIHISSVSEMASGVEYIEDGDDNEDDFAENFADIIGKLRYKVTLKPLALEFFVS